MTITNTDAMSQLRQRGIAQVIIYFSGGNDEGGADSVEAFDTAGAPVELPASNAHPNSVWANGSWQDQGWVVWEHKTREYRAATDDEIATSQLMELLEAPIYDRYGSFAGDFSVHGTVTWDVDANSHEMHGEEEVSHWESF